MKKTAVWVCGLTLFFLSLYLGIRQLPSTTCGFLHYEVTSIDSNGLEFCKGDAGSFYDLKALPFPLKIELTGECALHKDTPATLTFILKGPGGKTLLPHEIAKSHTELVHLLIVNSQLEDYQHHHPTCLSLNGEWQVNFTPHSAGKYTVYAQVVHAKTKRMLIAATSIDIVGEKANFHSHFTAEIYALPEQLGSIAIKKPLLSPQAPFKLNITITPAIPTPLEPLMGAYAHAVVFAPNKEGFAHLHPLASSTTSPKKSELSFIFQPLFEGPQRLFVQFKLAGNEIIMPFDLLVAED